MGVASGAFAAGFVAETEKLLGKPLADCFDLLAGASTGALIALGLAFDLAPSDIEAFYRARGRSIFSARNSDHPVKLHNKVLFWLAKRNFSALREGGVDINWLLSAKYDSGHLKKALQEIFGTKTLEDAKRRLVVPAIDLVKGQTIVFKTAHCPGMVRDRSFSAVDIALAATAAPTYFQSAIIEEGSAYADGGLWANDPALVAYVEAVRISEECKREVDVPFSATDIRVLSIGTGRLPFHLHPLASDAGILYWAPEIMDLMGLVQSQGVHFQMKHMIRDRYHRVDFLIPNNSWRLDHVAVIDDLIHLGREAARSEYAQIESEFFEAPGTPLSAFPSRAA